MKKIYWVLLAVIVIVVGYFWTSYNGFVTLQQGVESKWSNVETQYQRRSDLIPNLVATVKGYATHEQETLEQVVAARSAATSVTGNTTEFAAAQEGVTSALSRLIAIAEQYPDLKANQNFLELQSQLEGTENRIAVARQEYNEMVKRYNIAISKFPAKVVASMFGFEKSELFKAAEGSAEAPKVEF